MPTISISVDFQRVEQVLAGVRERAQNLAPAMAQFPGILRNGPGGFAEQIAARSFEDLGGARHPWQEPAYTRGAFPPAAQAREAVLWDAARGGAGSITRSDARSATVGVDDLAVRQISAGIGNGVVSADNYFGAVTGNFGERLAPITVVPSKPAIRRRAAAVHRRRVRAAQEDRAARIFIGLTYGTWFTLERFLRGIELPPKPIGVSGRSLAAGRDAIAAYILGRPVSSAPAASLQRAA